MPGYAPASSILAIYLSILVGFEKKKKFTVEVIAFSLRRMVLMKPFFEPIFGFEVPCLVLLISVGLRAQNVPFGVYAFHRLGCVLDCGNSSVFSCSAHVEKLRIISRQSPLPRHLWVSPLTARRCVVVMTGVMTHFRYYQKQTKSLSFGLEPPMHRSGSIEPTICIPCNNRPCQISSTSISIREAPEKPVFGL